MSREPGQGAFENNDGHYPCALPEGLPADAEMSVDCAAAAAGNAVLDTSNPTELLGVGG